MFSTESANHGGGGLPEAYRIDVCGIHADGYTTGEWYQREPNGRRWTRPGAGLALPVRPNTRYAVKMDLALPPGAGTVRVEVDGKILKSVTAPVDTLTEAEFTSGETAQVELVFGGEGWVLLLATVIGLAVIRFLGPRKSRPPRDKEIVAELWNWVAAVNNK